MVVIVVMPQCYTKFYFVMNLIIHRKMDKFFKEIVMKQQVVMHQH